MDVVYIYAKVNFYFDQKEFTEINLLLLFLSLIFYILKKY